MLEHSQLAVSAPSGAPQQWHDIDWWRVQRNVRAMQIRIAKACREGNWRRVKALQRMLTRSRSARYLAVRRVTENQGKRTAGVDRVLWDTPDAKWKAANGLKRHGYKPRPLRRVFIPKSNGKERPLGIPTMTDRAMQALYLLALAPIAETTGDPNSYGFRIERSTADAMGQLFVCLSKKVSAQWVLEADIKGCFDHINHDWLITNVPTDKVVLRKWLKAGVIHKGQLQATDAGTPQGGIVSPSLANLVLDGLESQLKQHLGVTKAKKLKINVVRYADDFVITGTSREVLETEVRPWVEQFLGNIFETREVIQVDGSKAVEFVNTIHDVLTSPSYLKEVANARRLPAACRACDERMLCQANCGVLHEQWNQQDECPGFKTFIKRVRFLVEEEGVRPKSVLQGANQLPQNLIAVG
ncbi:reverse transcriptase domain-containing protein [Pseudomonas aeruginosa]|uniref:reverse transcriptase domain-containing protein n=1 Tax=Pseudomonas aeruginosa TaxID=287 RepID=UPI0021BBC820|nr:reverse transcriptase domain-containing protein [Pseudomonas aeruginosa]